MANEMVAHSPAQDTATVIEVGDFIKARRTTCCGIVLRTGELTAGRTPIPGYWVVLASGREDVGGPRR